MTRGTAMQTVGRCERRKGRAAHWFSSSLAAAWLGLTCVLGAAEVDGGRSWSRLLVGGCGLGYLAIIDAEGRVQWRMAQKGEVSDVWRLPNGTTLVCSWGGHGGGGPAVLEVSPDKKVVWQSPPAIRNRVSAVDVLPGE